METRTPTRFEVGTGGAARRLSWIRGRVASDTASRRRRRVILLAGADAVALALAVFAEAIGSGFAGGRAQHPGWIAAFVTVTLAALVIRGGYRFRLAASPVDHLGQVIVATALAATFLVTTRGLLVPENAAAGEVARLWLFATFYLVAARLAVAVAVQHAYRRGPNTLIVGAGAVGRLVAQRLVERPEMGLRPVGFLDADPLAAPGGDDSRLPVLGATSELEDVVHRESVEHVVIAFSRAPHAVLLGLVRRSRALGVDVSVVPRLFEEVSNRVSVEHVGGVALLRIERTDPRGWQFAVKHAIDRMAAGAGLLLLAPVLGLIAVLVRVSSPGPTLFRQPRVGRDGQLFDMLKFRTMAMADDDVAANAAWDRYLAQAEASDAQQGGPGAVVVDRRTPIGRVLRRTSLDELPQLVNVLRGDMSLIGPRPELPGYVEAFQQRLYRYGDRHRVKSGLTGWAQVQGLRGDTSLQDRIDWDNYYVENWSPWLDLKILLLTIPAVIGGKGAK